MPLVSPGINVTVTDESFYVSAGPGTVPLIFLATEQDKLNSSGDAIADGTTKANAGKLYLMTSQRELLQTFGVPNFNNVGGSSQHGNELNEHGLLAAYSYLGNANRAYVVRGDLDLGQLQPLNNAPVGDPVDGTYWLDTEETDYGIYSFQNGVWQKQTPIFVVDDANDLPAPPSPGAYQGDYAVEVTDNEITIYRYSGNWIKVTASAGQWDYQVKKVYPTTQYAGGVLDENNPEDSWVNANEVNFGIKIWDASIGAFISQEAPAFLDDAEASAYYGVALEDGSLYINYGEESEVFTLMRYNVVTALWEPLSYQAGTTSPTTATEAGTLWYSNDLVVDLMINDGAGAWDEISATVSLQPSEPDSPSADDIWIDTDQLDAYPVIYKYNGSVWVQVDNADQTTPNGIIFGDARPAPGELLDADAPDPLLYPEGMLLWNSRYSTMNVKQWTPGYTFEGTLIGDRWVSVSGNALDGSLLSGRKAQRQMVVEALAASVLDNEEIRAESVVFNLMSAPGYVELTDELISLNVDRKEKGFIIADAPMRLSSSATEMQAWAQNSNGAAVNGEDGLIAADPYVGVYYPACLTTNVDGESVVQPSSHAILRTMAYNDQVAYQWFAPAGLQRGRVQNAESVGYLSAESEFVPVQLNEGQRDTLYVNKINPIAFIPGSGLVVYGQKTRNPSESALDRINVARLINYIRYQSEQLARPFLFEPNDDLTRANVKDAFDRFIAELVTLRGVYDFLVVCDKSNNTNARIDRNELWIDIAIQPVKAIEFINIPIRIRNTGADLS
jgi:hypothetical protein